MNSRDRILREITHAGSVESMMPVASINAIDYLNRKQQFSEVLTLVGGTVLEVESEAAVESYLLKQFPKERKLVYVKDEESVQLSKDELYNIEIACIKGGLAVAENAAIWVTERNMGNRLLPFSCENLIIVINEENIVSNMQQAYEQININEDGYGVFIAGPSKTADIEQSLVIGAHGPVRFTAIIIKKPWKIVHKEF